MVYVRLFLALAASSASVHSRSASTGSIPRRRVKQAMPYAWYPVALPSSTMAPSLFISLSLGQGPDGCLYAHSTISTKPESARRLVRDPDCIIGRPIVVIASSSLNKNILIGWSLGTSPSSLHTSKLNSASSRYPPGLRQLFLNVPRPRARGFSDDDDAGGGEEGVPVDL